MTDNQRTALEAMGEARARHLLAQGMMVHHLMVPAYEWLDELDAKRKETSDAIDKGIKPGSDVGEHPQGSGGGQAAETGGGDSVSGSG